MIRIALQHLIESFHGLLVTTVDHVVEATKVEIFRLFARTVKLPLFPIPSETTRSPGDIEEQNQSRSRKGAFAERISRTFRTAA